MEDDGLATMDDLSIYPASHVRHQIYVSPDRQLRLIYLQPRSILW